MKEQKKLAAHYLVSFYNDVVTLRRFYGLYVMELNKMKAKYKSFMQMSDKESLLKNIQLEESDKQTINQYMDNIKFHLNILVPQYKNINKNILKTEEFDEFDRLYHEVSEQLIIVQDDLTKLMQVLEEFLLNSVIDDLLTSAQDVYNAVYGTEQQPDKQV